MGLTIGFSGARDAGSGRRARRNSGGGAALLPGDPDPGRFEIATLDVHGSYVIAEIIWLDADNYEGRKLAIYEATPAELRAAERLDPHFAEDRGPLVPIARLEPTKRGWQMARSLCRALTEGP